MILSKTVQLHFSLTLRLKRNYNVKLYDQEGSCLLQSASASSRRILCNQCNDFVRMLALPHGSTRLINLSGAVWGHPGAYCLGPGMPCGSHVPLHRRRTSIDDLALILYKRRVFSCLLWVALVTPPQKNLFTAVL